MTTLDIDKVLLTIKEACESLGVSRSMLYELISRGELKVVKLSRRPKSGVRLRPQDLQEFADRHAVRIRR